MMNKKGFSLISLLLIISFLIGAFYLGRMSTKQLKTVGNNPSPSIISDDYEFKGKCSVDECLFKDTRGIGVVGTGIVKGYYSPYETTRGFGNEEKVKCDGFTVIDATTKFKEFVIAPHSLRDGKNQGTYIQEGKVILNVSKDRVPSADWNKITNSSSENPISFSVFVPPAAEKELSACESLLKIQNIEPNELKLSVL